MVKALDGRSGKVAMLGLTEQYIDQQAFAGFRSVVEKTGVTIMEPQHDRGDSAVAARVAGTLIQSTPDLVGIAGFDSESGPGIGLAIREANKTGKIVATCVDAEAGPSPPDSGGRPHRGHRPETRAVHLLRPETPVRSQPQSAEAQRGR